MRKYLDDFDRMVMNIRVGASVQMTAGKMAISKSVKEAHWRLNEAEHELQHKALGGFWQKFYWPYGSRRNASPRMVELADLPVEHQGDATRTVDFYWDYNE
jgi:hypothetical protein